MKVKAFNVLVISILKFLGKKEKKMNAAMAKQFCKLFNEIVQMRTIREAWVSNGVPTDFFKSSFIRPIKTDQREKATKE